MSVLTKLEDEFNSQMNDLSKMELGSDEYLNTVKGTCLLADKIITIQKQDDEFELKCREINNAEEARKLEEKQTKQRGKIEWAKILVPTACAVGMGVASMIWEKFDTMSLTAGKNSWRDLISFKGYK